MYFRGSRMERTGGTRERDILFEWDVHNCNGVKLFSSLTESKSLTSSMSS